MAWPRFFTRQQRPPQPTESLTPAVPDPYRSVSIADSDLSFKKKFIIDPDFAHRFNAYATACFPNEIGAVVRIVEDDQAFTAVDFAVLPQSVSPTYFEFSTEGQAQFQMDLATSGRGAELAEWYGLIHSHPNMTPFMSGTDVDNLWKLAGNKRGFSLICATHRQPDSNYFSVNYAQGGSVPLMIKRLPHNSGSHLGGTGTISADELQNIADEVAEKTTGRGDGWRGAGYRREKSVNRPLYIDSQELSAPDSATATATAVIPGQEILPGFDDDPLWFEGQDDFDSPVIEVDGDNALSSEVIITALRLAEDLGIATDRQVAEISHRIALSEALSYNQADILVTALAEYPFTDDRNEERAVQDLIDQLSEQLDEQG